MGSLGECAHRLLQPGRREIEESADLQRQVPPRLVYQMNGLGWRAEILQHQLQAAGTALTVHLIVEHARQSQARDGGVGRRLGRADDQARMDGKRFLGLADLEGPALRRERVLERDAIVILELFGRFRRAAARQI